jgi:hypothetical protein
MTSSNGFSNVVNVGMDFLCFDFGVQVVKILPQNHKVQPYGSTAAVKTSTVIEFSGGHQFPPDRPPQAITEDYANSRRTGGPNTTETVYAAFAAKFVFDSPQLSQQTYK